MPARTILMIAPEAVPFAKTGGLGDVAGALPVALSHLGHTVVLVLPRYRGIEGGSVIDRLPIVMAGRTYETAFVEHPVAERVRVVTLDCPELYDRPQLYGVGNVDYPDNAVRFAVLARAALEHAARGGDRPDVVHAHDWQSGLAPVYLKTIFAHHPVLGRAASVFTIHNLAYQGLFPPSSMPDLDLDWSLYHIDGLEFWGKVSFLKGGINYADRVTTVSARYAREIQTPEFGAGFDGILRRRGRVLHGVLNGIDTRVWNPESDPLLPEPFGPDTLERKQSSRRALLEALGVRVSKPMLRRPIVGMVSRLVDQKGFDLLADLADRLPSLAATFAVLGTGEAKYQDLWLRLAAVHPEQFGVRIGFDEALAHLVEAGSDIFLMPSRFEPCGLNQMYSLRYGTVPVVCATGGLDDTVHAWNPRTLQGNGFKFREHSAEALLRTLEKAIEAFADRRAWRVLQRNGMREDHSWEAAAGEYAEIYEKAIAHRH